VSLMTVHRDLDALQTQGWLRKIRGGAIAQPPANFHGDIRHDVPGRLPDICGFHQADLVHEGVPLEKSSLHVRLCIGIH
jgi:hypothetical protein